MGEGREPPSAGDSGQPPPPDDHETPRRQRGKTVHGELANAGHRVLAAGGGEEALLLIARERPDLLVLDLLYTPRQSRLLREAAAAGAGAVCACSAPVATSRLPASAWRAARAVGVMRKRVQERFI